MKTLRDHTILYDDECPMCNLYTGAFVNAGMLEKEGRVAFTKMPENIRQYIDYNRACNEIALVNVKSGNVRYGIDSIMTIVGHRFPWLRPLFETSVFRWIASRFYSFISYNRKVIAPGRIFEQSNSCTPKFHVGYRWAYLVFAWLITSMILTAYGKLLPTFLPAGTFGREFLICGGQIGFQSVTIFFLRRERLLHYLGNMMTISLAGSFLLTPALIAAHFHLVQQELFYVFWFGGVVSLMFWEHLRRVTHLGIHWSASLSWVVYRFLVLMILFFLL